MKKTWLETASEALLEKSIEKVDFNIARLEWRYVGVVDNLNCDGSCQLCGFNPIRYEYELINIYNSNQLIVGSECIGKFTNNYTIDLLDTYGNIVDKTRVTGDRNDYFKKKLHEQLDNITKYERNSFVLSIVEEIKEIGKLTPNQLKCTKQIYHKLSDLGKIAFKQTIHVKLAKDREKEQIENMKETDLRFVMQFMTSSQRSKYLYCLPE